VLRLLTAAALALLGLLGSPAAVAAPVKAAVKGFEDGDLSGWTQELAHDYSCEVVTAPVRCGKYAARFEIRQGDSPPGVVNYRAELHELLDYRAPMGSTAWYGFSTFIPSDWVDLDNRAVIAQWHATPDLFKGEVWRSPPLAVRYRKGAMYVTARWSAEAVQKKNDAPQKELYRHPGAWPKGRWRDWVFQVRWSYKSDGLVNAWLDGKQVIKYAGPVGYNDRDGPWFKWGIYRDDHATTQALVHDEYRRGNSFKEVDPSNCAVYAPADSGPADSGPADRGKDLAAALPPTGGDDGCALQRTGGQGPGEAGLILLVMLLSLARRRYRRWGPTLQPGISRSKDQQQS